MRRIACPLCCCDQCTTIARLAGPWCFRVRNVVCKGCGFVYRNPQWDDRESARFYAHASHYYAQVYDNLRLSEAREGPETQAAQARLAELRQWLSPPARLLDVGAGSGALVKVARAAGFEAMGLELDQEACKAAQERGVPMMHGSLEHCRHPTASFAAVTAFHVLEHVTDVHRFLAKAYRLCGADGLLLIEVPDTETVRVPIKDYLLPEHNWHFTGRSLRALLASTGWHVEMEKVARREGFTADVLLAVARRPVGEPFVERHHHRQPGEHDRMVALMRNTDRLNRRTKGMILRDALARCLGPWFGRRAFRALRRLVQGRIRRACRATLGTDTRAETRGDGLRHP